MILEASLRPNIGETLFGPRLEVGKGYDEIFRRWRRKKAVILPVCRVLAYPVGVVVEVVVGILEVGKWLFRGVVRSGGKELW